MNDRTNTIFGWILFAGIIGLGMSIVSSKIFHADDPMRPETLGFVVEGVETEGGDEGDYDLGALLAVADVAKGETAATARCGSCHSFNQGGPTGTGPNLYGIYGSPVGGHAAGFAYSSALKDKGGNWGWENMDAWLKSPRGWAPGTKMSFAGLGNDEDRANILLYLNTLGGGLTPPPPKATDEPEAEDGDGVPEPAQVNDPDGLAEEAKLEGQAAAAGPTGSSNAGTRAQ